MDITSFSELGVKKVPKNTFYLKKNLNQLICNQNIISCTPSKQKRQNSIYENNDNNVHFIRQFNIKNLFGYNTPFWVRRKMANFLFF